MTLVQHAITETPAFRDRVARIHDDVLTAMPQRFQDWRENPYAEPFAADAFESAVLVACEDFDHNHGELPDLANDETWHRWLLPVVLDRLGLDYDEVYPVTREPASTIEPLIWRKWERSAA